MKFKAIIILSVVFLTSVLSCKKFIEVSPSSNLIDQELVFSNDQTATSSVMGLYARMVSLSLSLSNGGLSIYPGLSSDEIYNTSTNANYDAFLSNIIPTNNGIIGSNFWTQAYRNLYQANAVIEGLQSSTSITIPVKNQLIGEVKLIRAFHFFYLVNLFGDVPLTITTDYEINAIMPRTSKNLIYQQIISDLKEAKTLLNVNYPSNFRVRPNKWAADALLARVYLYLGDWINAESESTLVINSPLYNLETDHNLTFLNSSKEAIWQLMKETANTAEGAAFIPTSATVKPAFSLTPALLNVFEPGDLRRTNWIKSNTVSSEVYNYPNKYKIRSGTAVSEYLIALRLSEQYLIRAEARAQQDNTTDAVSDLNAIRARSRAPISVLVPNPLPALPSTLLKPDVLDAISKERQRELFAEWGHRWFDLKRTNKADVVLDALKPQWKSSAALYPIPYAETQINIFLTQNPGYVQ